METLDQYNALRNEIFEYFEYQEDWRILPIDDARRYVWRLDGEGPGSVTFAETEEELNGDGSAYYRNEIYTQRHLPRWVYRGLEYTMIVVDTHCDGNQFLQIFTNANMR